MIIIKNLSKKYTGNNKPTLDNISYEFNNTGLYYLIGKSGSGKSTFLSIVGGMDFSFDGSVFVDGIDIKKMSKDEKDKYRYEKISFMFQDFKGDDETVNDNLMQVLSITSLSKEEKEERITNLLKQVELSDYRKRKIKSLSGGQRKRISLVRALLKDAPILLCDEPVSSLNKELRKKVIDMLTIESKRRLVIIITHEEIEDNNKISIIKLRDGKFEDIKSFKNDNETIKVGYKRKRYFGITPFIDILKIFKRRHSLLIASIITLTISLFTISFSFLLSNGVNSSLSSSLSTYMDNNSLVISNNDESFISNGLKSVDYTTIEYIKNKH
jgi:ABC-type lipoprotein export system ATPase subunit